MFNISKSNWKMTKSLIKEVVDNEGIVFGGAVRDVVRHCHFASEFYKKFEDGAGFADPTIYPETSDRLLVPNDIDCFFADFEAVDRFRSRVKQIGYTVIDTGATSYTTLPHGFSKATLHIKPQMNKIVRNMLWDSGVMVHDMKIKMDIIWSNTDDMEEHPFESVDFDCNSLIFDKSSISSGMMDLLPKLSVVAAKDIFTAYEYTKKITKIIDNIIQKKMVIINRIPHRITKMVCKGWTIIDPSAFQPMVAVPVEEPCIICLENVSVCDHFMRNCCSAHYHKKCLQKVLRTCSSCPQCRTNL